MSPDRTTHPTEALSAYLDGELAAAERSGLERHLESCRACTALLEDLRRLAVASREEGTPPPPPDLSARILQRLGAPAAAPAARRRRPLLFRLPLAAAASLAALAVLWIVWLREPALRTPPPLEGQAAEAPAGLERRPQAPPPSGGKGASGDEAREAAPEAGMRPASGSAVDSEKKQAASGAAAAERQAAVERIRPAAPKVVPPPASVRAAEATPTGAAAAGRGASPGAAPEDALREGTAEAEAREAGGAAAGRLSRTAAEPEVAKAAPPTEPQWLRKEEGAAPAADSQPAPVVQHFAPPAPEAAPEPEQTGFVEADRAQRGEPEQARDKTAMSGRADALPAAGAGRLLLYADGYRLTLREDGGLTLLAAGYECEVAPRETRAAAAQRDSRAAFEQARASTEKNEDAAFRSIPAGERFVDVAGGAVELSQAAADEDVPQKLLAAATDEEVAELPRLLLVEQGEGGDLTLRLPGPDLVPELQARIEALVREHYAARLRETCGPPPPPFRPPD